MVFLILVLLFFLFPKTKSLAVEQCRGSFTRNVLQCECPWLWEYGGYYCDCVEEPTTYFCEWNFGCVHEFYEGDGCIDGDLSHFCNIWQGDYGVRSTQGCYTCDDACDTECTCGSSNFCCGEPCPNNECGEPCPAEPNTDQWTGCSVCSTPFCGQPMGFSVCGNFCGTCSDRRSSSWSSPLEGQIFTHDYPINISGWAKDTNGVVDGVGKVDIFLNGQAEANLIAGFQANSSDGVFKGEIRAAKNIFYPPKLKGTVTHNLYGKAIKRDGDGDCSDWWLRNTGPDKKTISIRNSPPVNGSLSPINGDVFFNFGGPVVTFTATFSDPDPQTLVSGRDHDIRTFRVRIGEAGSALAFFDYTDNETGPSETLSFQDFGPGMTMSSATIVQRTQGGDLKVAFDLDFSGVSSDYFGTYNVYFNSQDWAEAGANDNWKLVGWLTIWNCSDVIFEGNVYDVTYYYPNVVCTNLGEGAPNVSDLASVDVSFTPSGGGEPVVFKTDGSGYYSGTLTYGEAYNYSLNLADYFNVIADLRDVGGDCRGGVTGTFTLSGEDYRARVNFGMTRIFDAWIQVVGGDLTSYSGITNIIPFPCANDPGCRPYIAINDPDLGFDENGIVSANGAINWGSASGAGVGDPSDWKVENANFWYRPNYGSSHFLSLLGGEYLEEGDHNLSEFTDGSIGSGEKVIKIVSGNLRADRNLTVAPGGLGLFIASGDVIVSGDVTNLEGIYLSDEDFIIENDADGEGEQILLEGIFAADANGDGGGQVINNRDLGGTGGSGDLTNNTSPAAVFQYRPDFLIDLIVDNTAIESTTSWEEIKP